MNELPRRCGIAAQLCAVVPWIPIAVVLFRFPEQWPICAALGATLIVANNCLWYWFTKAASTAIETMGIHTSPLMRETRFWLRGWRETSLITLFCLYAVAVLLAFGILQDAALYALLLAVVVNGRVYFANLRSDAPHIRTGIQRFTHGYRRAEAVRGSDVRIRAGALDTRPTAYDP